MSRYKCDNCGYTADERKFPEAKHLSQRLDPGGKYTDRECPKRDCGALAYPVRRPAPRKRTKPVCATCGSDDVKGDAYAVWDVESQSWEVAGGDVFDGGSVCEKCGGETRLKWIRA